MFRGDVWDAHFPRPVGPRPCVVLTRDVLIPRLGSITVAEITSIEGPGSTHIEVGVEAGLTSRSRSWVNVTGLHTIPKGRLRRHRGRLASEQLAHVAAVVRDYLDLDDLDVG